MPHSPSVSASVVIAVATSIDDVAVRARPMIPSGHTKPYGVCGLPSPAAYRPEK